MEMTLQIPFKQLLTMVKTLTPSQKAKLRAELYEEQSLSNQKEHTIDYLLKGPVYDETDISIIEDNRKSIAKWRTKN
jgi:hypothetical protein